MGAAQGHRLAEGRLAEGQHEAEDPGLVAALLRLSAAPFHGVGVPAGTALPDVI